PLRAPRDRVLVDVLVDGSLRRLLQLRRAREVREPLRQVDRVVLDGQPRHLPDHRLRERQRLLRGPRSSHGHTRYGTGRGCWSPLRGSRRRERVPENARIAPSIRVALTPTTMRREVRLVRGIAAGLDDLRGR